MSFEKKDGRKLGNCTVGFEIPTDNVMAVAIAKGGTKSALIRISPIAGQTHGRVLKVIDQRPQSIKVAEGLTKMNLAKRYGGAWLEGKFAKAEAEAKTAWDAAFSAPALATLGTETDEDTGRKFQVLFLSEPEGDVNGLLALTRMTTGTGIGAYSYRADYPGSWLRKAAIRGTGDVMHFAMLTFSTAAAPVMIIERTFGEGDMIMTDYSFKSEASTVQRVFKLEETEWLLGGPDNDTEAESDDVVAEHPLANFVQELKIDAEQAGAFIDGDIGTVEALAKRKSTAALAKELGVPQKILTAAITAAKAILTANGNGKK